VLGTGFLLLFFGSVFVLACQRLRHVSTKGEWLRTVSVFVPWFLLTIAVFLFSFNAALIIALFVFSGLLIAQLDHTEKHLTFGRTRLMTVFSSILFGGFALVLFIGIFLTTERYAAEIAYAKAIRADRDKADTKEIVAWLDRAATLNRFQDDYYRVLSQALLLRVKDELKGASQKELSESSRTYVQSLIAASVNAAARATEISPYSVTNWLVRAE
jgi:flagellar basal body-associated protein FliL